MHADLPQIMAHVVNGSRRYGNDPRRFVSDHLEGVRDVTVALGISTGAVVKNQVSHPDNRVEMAEYHSEGRPLRLANCSRLVQAPQSIQGIAGPDARKEGRCHAMAKFGVISQHLVGRRFGPRKLVNKSSQRLIVMLIGDNERLVKAPQSGLGGRRLAHGWALLLHGRAYVVGGLQNLPFYCSREGV